MPENPGNKTVSLSQIGDFDKKNYKVRHVLKMTFVMAFFAKIDFFLCPWRSSQL